MERLRSADGLFTCPCCGYATLSAVASYEICRICFWEDDGQDDPDADENMGGPNHISLTQGRIDFLQHGASDPKDLRHCRAPGAGEVRMRVFEISDGRLTETTKA